MPASEITTAFAVFSWCCDHRTCAVNTYNIYNGPVRDDFPVVVDDDLNLIRLGKLAVDEKMVKLHSSLPINGQV